MVSEQITERFRWEDCLYLFSSRWYVVLLIGSLVWLAGASAKRKLPPLYEVEAHLTLQKDASGNDFDPVSRRFPTASEHDLLREAAELDSRTLLSEVAGALDLSSLWKIKDVGALMSRLESRVEVGILPESNSLLLRARGESPSEASDLANAIADRFVARKDAEARAELGARMRRLKQEMLGRHAEVKLIDAELVAMASDPAATPFESSQLRRRRVAVRNLIHSLEAKHQLALIEADEVHGKARLVAPARPDAAVATTSIWLTVPSIFMAGLFAGFGTVLGLAVIFRRSRWDAISHLTSRLEVHFAGFAPLTGGGSVTPSVIPDTILESYRDLRNRILRLPAGECVWMTMMPLSRKEPYGEAITSLACVLADSGSTVLVIDADFRGPSLHQYFEAAQHPGLSDYLTGAMRLEETVIRSRRANLWFMPSGPLHDDPSGLLIGKRMEDLVRDLRSRFDYVLVASPSIHEVSDAGVLASISEFNTIITPYRGISFRRLHETRVALQTVGAPLSGVILSTRVKTVQPTMRAASLKTSRTLPAGFVH